MKTSVGFKLGLAFCGVLLVLVTALLLNLREVRRLSDAVRWLQSEGLHRQRLALQAQRLALGQERLLYALVLAEQRDARVALYPRIDQIKDELTETLTALEGFALEAHDRQTLADARRDRTSFQEEYDGVVDIIELGQFAAARARVTLSTTPPLDAFIAALDAMVRDRGGQVDDYVAQAGEQAASAYVLALGLTGLAVVVSLLSAWLIARSVRSNAQRLQHLVDERTRELVASNARLEMINRSDPLTGVANRRHLDEILTREWARASRDFAPGELALVMVDVDYFKSYNDHLGHPAGDACLQRLAKEMQSCLHRQSDLLARYGGEEFTLVLFNTPMDRALPLVESLRLHIERLAIPHPRGTDAVVTVSAGIACCVPGAELSPARLIQWADEALYEAKQRGRNRVCAHVAGELVESPSVITT